MLCYDVVMANVETTRYFNVYGFGSSFIDEICMKLNEVEVKSDVLSAEAIGDIFSLTGRSVF